ncbi:MAG: Gfo/Idh/MocA family oxidoreductase [Desulfobacterales bacterium]|nr:Gfo/Idh/MocA family oxidoreductase [Desulfobacterales bacterium]
MVNTAVIGCGYWGPNLIRNFFSLSDCNVKSVSDVDTKRLDHIKSLYPRIRTLKEYTGIINDPDIQAVAIATPVRFHYEMAKLSLENRKHTFIEKPMASSVAECKELIEIAKKNKLILMVGHTFIYSTPVQKIKQIFDSGELGKIQYISCKRLNLGLFQKDINVAWDLAPHDISIILHLMGDMPESINCQGKAHVNPNIEDVTCMTLNFRDNALAIIQSSWLDPNKVREITFVGTKKMLVYDDIEPNEKIRIYDKSVDIPPHYDTFAEFQYSYHYGDMHCPYMKLTEPLRVECQHFIDCIKNKSTPLSNGEEGLKVVQVLEYASESLSKNGANVKIPC